MKHSQSGGAYISSDVDATTDYYETAEEPEDEDATNRARPWRGDTKDVRNQEVIGRRKWAMMEC